MSRNQILNPSSFMKVTLVIPISSDANNLHDHTLNVPNTQKGDPDQSDCMYNEIYLSMTGNMNKYFEFSNEFICELKFIDSLNHDMYDATLKIEFSKNVSISHCVCQVSWARINIGNMLND